MDTTMDTVIFEVMSPAAALGDAAGRWKSGRSAGAARIRFASPEVMWKVLTAKRWEILKAMTGAGALGVRELSRRVGRDVKGVHTDASALVTAGVIDRLEDGKLVFPYRHVEVQFKLDAAA